MKKAECHFCCMMNGIKMTEEKFNLVINNGGPRVYVCRWGHLSQLVCKISCTIFPLIPLEPFFT